METISTSIRLPRDLHDRLLLLQTERQKEHPRRRVTVTEVAVEVMERGFAGIVGVGGSVGGSVDTDSASPVPPCPKCGKELHWSCYRETGFAFCERHQTRLGEALEPGCDFRAPIRRVGDRFEFCPQEIDAVSVPLMGGGPAVSAAFTEEFGSPPEEFAGRTDVYGWTTHWSDGTPAMQSLACRGRGPSASRGWQDGVWGEWVVTAEGSAKKEDK